MKINTRASLAAASTLMLTALLAACGGGGGGGTTPPTNGGGGGGSTPAPPNTTPTPPGSTPGPGSTPTPTPTASPGGTGTVTISGKALANATVVFTCGCTGDGGKITTNASGQYSVGFSAPSVANPGQKYSPTLGNLMIVGYAPSSQTQTWTMMFLGSTPSHDLNLSSTPNNASANVSDTASTAAALYVYYAAATQLKASVTDRTFNWFNFNTIAQFAQHLRAGQGLTAAETKLLNDITAQQTAGKSLFPGSKLPTWNAVSTDGLNSTVTNDLSAVASGGISADGTLPTPCPSAGSCTGAPTP